MKRNGIDILMMGIIVMVACIVMLGVQRTQPSNYAIEWSTENNLDILGFHVLRADCLTCEYRQLSDNLIPTSVDPVNGGEYQFVDEGVDFGRTYYYKLKTINRNGSTQISAAPIILP